MADKRRFSAPKERYVPKPAPPPTLVPLPTVVVPSTTIQEDEKEGEGTHTPREYDVNLLGMLVAVLDRLYYYVSVDMQDFLAKNVNGAMRRDATAYCTITVAETLKHLRLPKYLQRELHVTWWLRIRAMLAHYYEVIDWELIFSGHFDENLDTVLSTIKKLYEQQTI